jgi:tRNA A-37 threonylcarbamoyl transferase component Bud32
MNDSNSSPTHCPRCGATLPADAPEGLCPRCLAALHFGPETALTGAESAGAQPPLSAEELAPHFPQLEILECLGRGGMGVVYKARQKSLNRTVAIKLLAPERVRDAKFAERFTGEAHALAKLNHPHIVTVYDFGEAGGFYYLLMEYVDGVNLRQAMKAGRFTPEQALAIVPPVCEALQYAHEHGIVHRDIKPENLLLDKEGRVKIADFGIAKMLGAEASEAGIAETQAGTPQYMAPEQKERRRTDHRADIYSLGVVLYEMLTGELPAEKLRPPSSRPGGVRIDVRLDEIVLRALEKTPELRYQTAADLKTQLETITPDAGKTDFPSSKPGIPSSPSETARLSRGAIAGAVWACLLFPGFLVAFILVRISVAESHWPTWWQQLLASALLPLGATAPFGATILGWIGVARIRRSQGRLRGLGLAVFDGMLFPLLALDVLICIGLGPLLERSYAAGFRDTWFSGAPPIAITILLLGLSAIVDLLITRRVWRAVRPNGSRSHSPWLSTGVVAAVVLLLPLTMALRAVLSYHAKPKPELPVVTCAKAYAGDVNEYLDSMGSILPPDPPSETQDNSHIAVTFTIAEDHTQQVLQKLKAKQPLPVEAYDPHLQKKIGEGLLTAIDNQIDATTGTIQCRAIIQASEDMVFLTNKLLKVRVLMEAKQGVTVLPLRAVQQDGQGASVYLVRQNRWVTIRPVIVGTIDGEIAEIKAGAAPGDTVVLERQAKLLEGSAVRCKTAQHQSGNTAPPPITQSTPAPVAQFKPVLNAIPTSKPPIDPPAPPPIAESTPAPITPAAPTLSSTPAPTPTPSPTPTPPIFLTPKTTTDDIQREALLIQLRQATEVARQCEARFKVGASEASELVAANEKVDLLKAQIEGDPARAASIRLKAARRQAELAEARFKAGAADQSELLAARETVELLEAQIAGDAVQIAIVRLAAAERALKFAEIRSKAGEVTFLEVESARNAVELRRAELRDAKAVKGKASSTNPTAR